MKILESIKKQFDKLIDKYNAFLNHYFKKYIIDYEIMDDKVKIISSTGDYRVVKNTKGNISKLNQAIVKNKVNIQRKIDEYEATSKERFIVLIINLMAIIGFGVLICLTFFTGSYFLFIISILLFSLSVITSTLTSFNYFINVKEVTNLKKLTGYKSDVEFSISDFKLTK